MFKIKIGREKVQNKTEKFSENCANFREFEKGGSLVLSRRIGQHELGGEHAFHTENNEIFKFVFVYQYIYPDLMLLSVYSI